MIYHPTELMLDDRQREKLQGYDPGFPYTAIDCRFDGYSGPCVDWHWHATLEINVCASGVLKTSTQRGEYIVREGDAVLVNANVLHRNEAFEGAPGVCVQTHMFDRSLVAAAELPQRRYVAPVVECTLLDALPLLRENAEHRAVLEALDRAFAAAGEEKDGYERKLARVLPLLQAGTGHHAACHPHGLPPAQGRRTVARDRPLRQRHRRRLRLCQLQLLRQGLPQPHEPFAACLPPGLRRRLAER